MKADLKAREEQDSAQNVAWSTSLSESDLPNETLIAGETDLEVEQVEHKATTQSARLHTNAARYIVDAEELSYLNAKNGVRCS